MECTVQAGGRNNYNLPYKKKATLRSQLQIPQSITCETISAAPNIIGIIYV